MRALDRGLLAIALLSGFDAPATPPRRIAILRADGIGPAAAIVRFGTPKPTALQRAATILGRPLDQRRISDCGQGEPMGEVRFRGHLVLTFFHGRLSGWRLDGGKGYVTDKGIGIGSTRAMVIKAYPGTAVADGSLGVMFASESGVSGFLDANRASARVTELFAGETCMVS